VGRDAVLLETLRPKVKAWRAKQDRASWRDLSGADLSGANLREAYFWGANLSGANLEYAHLIETDFTGADLTGCRVFGISAWGLKLEKAKQQSLVITRKDEPEITVDNIEVAQFIYLMLHSEKIRDIIDTIGKKALLLLGRFTEHRKAVLDALREELRKRDYLPILFDFEKPVSRDTDETITLLARGALGCRFLGRTEVAGELWWLPGTGQRRAADAMSGRARASRNAARGLGTHEKGPADAGPVVAVCCHGSRGGSSIYLTAI
jgi:hypothetical protein